jgi:integration host factor subunit alpha
VHRSEGKTLTHLTLSHLFLSRTFIEFEVMTKPDVVSGTESGALPEGEPANKMPNGLEGSAGRSRTITRVDLAEAVYQQVGLSRKESAALVEMVLDEMTASLVAGTAVKLSSFGSFVIRHKGERIGRNPKTGVEVPITERRVLVFKPSNVLKARINGLPVPERGDDT